jgi:Sulfotransferase domain
MDSRELPLPTFLIIGAQKSATRWLRMNLGMHPDVFSATREIEFFNNGSRFAQQGAAWYREQFDGWSGERYVGEATPGYMFWRHQPRMVAERIREMIPAARLIAILRNPIDRAQSALVHHIEMGALPADAQLLDIVKQTPPERERLGIITGGWYAASLEPFQEIFGDQLLVLLHDDADDDPRGVYDQALRHVGPAADFVPPELERVRFSYSTRPSAESRKLTLGERRELYEEFFVDDIRKLEKMIGRDLSLWEPDSY